MASFRLPPRLFVPILAGATLRDRLAASAGAVAGLAATAAICGALPIGLSGAPALIAPLGASAVLLFAVPASPLAQPWSILGGNVVSACVGVGIAAGLGHGPVALGAAVGAAILAMSLLRCLHPPGGAVAMMAVIGGPAIWDAGLAFPFTLVALNAGVTVGIGWLFHRVSGHAYPHRPKPEQRPLISEHLHRDDVRRALEDAGEAFDISQADLEDLLERAEHHARLRAGSARSRLRRRRSAGSD